MLSLYDEASIEAALHQRLPAELRQLLRTRLAQAAASGLADLTHILVVEPGDSEGAIEEEIGFSPLVSLLDGARFGTAQFLPYWSWLQDLGGWYEMIVTVGDSGFAFILLIQKAPGVLPDLLALCEQHGGTAPCA